MSDQFHASAALPLGKELQEIIGYKDGQAPKQVWTW